MIFTLHDYHSGLIHNPSQTIYAPAILATYVDNQLVVVADPESKIIKPGKVVLRLNGVSINILQNNMREIVKAKGLIIDLRNNAGGNSAPGSWFAQHVYSTPTTALEFRWGGTGRWTPATLQSLSPHIQFLRQS